MLKQFCLCRDYELARDRIELSEIIGEVNIHTEEHTVDCTPHIQGQFGDVHRGSWRQNPSSEAQAVAVKTCKVGRGVCRTVCIVVCSAVCIVVCSLVGIVVCSAV